jgi:ankyrin repeat protein
MAAAGMGGDSVGRRAPRAQAQSLEAVKTAIELGADVNAANADGRTALDAAKALKYETVVKFLVDQGAVR